MKGSAVAFETHDKKLTQGINNAVTRLLLGLMTIVFVTLKLTNVIDWPWWGVLGPLWMPIVALLAVAAVLYLIAGVLMGISGIVEYVKRERRKKRSGR